MIKPATLFFVLICLQPVSAKTVFVSSENLEAECVVLLHGLARSARSMNPLQRALSVEGYSVLNIDYPSTRYTIEILVEQYIKPEIEKVRQSRCGAIHFVTHSMGGILARYYLKHNFLPTLGRVVMISPPNQGSELVDELGNFFLFKWLNGPAGAQLGTAESSLSNQLGPVDYDVAVITGDYSFNPIYSWLIPGDDDGKVAVNRAGVEGMNVFKVVPLSHTFIVRNNTLKELVVDYLKSGHLSGMEITEDLSSD